MPMICSSVKRLRFIPWSSQWARAYFKMDHPNGASQIICFWNLNQLSGSEAVRILLGFSKKRRSNSKVVLNDSCPH